MLKSLKIELSEKAIRIEERMCEKSEEFFMRKIAETKGSDVKLMKEIYGTKIVEVKVRAQLDKFHEYSCETY